MITREQTIFCEHGVARTTCRVCSPPSSPILTAATLRDHALPIVTGVLTVGRGCRWLGKAVLHCRDECDCANIPDDYVQVSRDGAPFTAYLVGIVRDTRIVPKFPFRRRAKVVGMDVKVMYLFQCRECWPKKHHFKTEQSAIDHLESYHHVTIETRITEVMTDVARAIANER